MSSSKVAQDLDLDLTKIYKLINKQYKSITHVFKSIIGCPVIGVASRDWTQISSIQTYYKKALRI